MEEKSHSSYTCRAKLYGFMSSCWQNCVGKDYLGTGLYVLFSKSDKGSYTLARRGTCTGVQYEHPTRHESCMTVLASGHQLHRVNLSPVFWIKLDPTRVCFPLHQT